MEKQRSRIDVAEMQISNLGERLDTLDRNLANNVDEEIDQIKLQIGAVSGNLDELKNDLIRTNQNITMIREDAEKARKKRWYSDISIIIAILSFLFALTTALVGYHQATQQKRLSDMTALREYLHRLGELRQQGIVLQADYRNDPNLGIMMGDINAQTNMMVSQAQRIVDKYKTDNDVTATQLLFLMSMAGNNGDYELLNELTDDAYDKAIKAENKNMYEIIVAIRAKAMLQFLAGKVEDGRQKYQEALDTANSMGSEMSYYKIVMNFETYYNWASSELSTKNCAKAAEMINKAAEIINDIPVGPIKSGYEQRLQTFAEFIEACE